MGRLQLSDPHALNHRVLLSHPLVNTLAHSDANWDADNKRHPQLHSDNKLQWQHQPVPQ